MFCERNEMTFSEKQKSCFIVFFFLFACVIKGSWLC